MRVMIVSAGGLGHLYPLLPLAYQLRSSGVDVVLAVPEHSVGPASRLGLAVIALSAPGVSTPSPETKAAQRACPPYRRGRLVLGRFLADSVAQLPALRAAIRDWRPDVLVRDATAFAAWLAGEELDVPVAVFDHAGTPVRLLAATNGDLFADARRDAGLSPDPHLRSLNHWLHLLGAPPRWFTQHSFGPTTHLFQPPLDMPVPREQPPWLRELDPARPFVYVTLGTVHNDTPGVFDALLDVLADEPRLQVLATLGPGTDTDRFDALPAHVRVESFVPQPLVLPHVDMVICHWGYGTLMGPLCHGVPMVLLPLAAGDSASVATRIERLGVGVVLPEQNATKAAIADAVTSVLTEFRYRDAARLVARSVRELPPFGCAAPLVEQLARTHRPVLNPAFGR
ncbi:glycosyltransferase [Pseudonocardia spinosispora]|uniref:glycosyltransferase n=1 Tax=Pseudonocardia spinosispora TaxID=103441 RepID=UPI0003FFC094|nr:glycosyltransferase [Pseudonocardia spinosispora]